jgi:crotonobetaine/carnitine-CoA ligase
MYNVRPLPVIISQRAQATPNDTAITSISTNERFTWQDIDQNIRLWADAYRRRHVVPGECVATLMPNTVDAYYAWLGLTWLQAVEVPINTDYQGEWLIHAINTAHARIIVTSRRFLQSLALVADQLKYVGIVVIYDAQPGDESGALSGFFRIITTQEFFFDAEPAYDLTEPQVWDPMSVVFTSGTTGRAKAVVLPWGMEEAQRLVYGPEFRESVLYGYWPPFHTLGKSLLFIAAAWDGSLVTRERFSISDFWDDVRTYGCTTAFTVSVIAQLLYNQPPREDDADNPLRAVLMGPTIPQVDDFKRRFGVNVYTTFGSTEIGSVLFSSMREVNSSNWQSSGRKMAEAPTEIAVVDEHDIPVGPGVLGELVVRPRIPWTMSLGYLNMPEETARAWRNGWFHTGDSFIYDEEGDYYFQDRTKDYIRRRGENISSFEVEHAVCEFSGVAQVAAVAARSEVGEDEVMVFVLPKPDQVIDPAELLVFLADRVPKFALPRFVEVVSQLPTTQATGRIQKTKLRERGPGPDTYDRLKVKV